ncbi:hypothetical protein NFHSH190041_19000 [Shewanella sp. NFH-SH190041]|uniref:type VI secretion system-associated FHA domain protein TagH n=1 Tax=Shewanella sp. NFH-SH190041 TaxID=2950245 RepID=UPI0021C38562|nr:type VI secretion system-associated FHA domain protein TagH [Shewanella sp. NFH-SH190041]BDM64448.1 hypothetical protein NFHSH190041_19000 [Shewanella sp. NFH-SH190041]
MNYFNQHSAAEAETQYLTLVVTNTQLLEPGLSATHRFDESGGTIGAAVGDTWELRDNAGKINQSHARIVMADGYFCLNDSSGACYLNGATIPVGYQRLVRLNDKDVILIGPYLLRVHFSTLGESFSWNQSGLEQVFPSDNEFNNIGTELNDSWKKTAPEMAVDDPLIALDAIKSEMQSADLDKNNSPLGQQELMQQTDYLLAKDQNWQGQCKTVHADSEHDMNSAIAMKKTLIEERNPMDDNTLAHLEAELKSQYPKYDYDEISLTGQPTEGNHLLTTPLLRGLGTQVGHSENMVEMQALAEEIGASLQSAIKGLLALHQQVKDSRYGMMNKNLQPIEDNPLRLGLPYDDTVQTMFDSQRSAVHLSAPSAISESLNNVRHHNEAVLVATTEALGQILHAFSPDLLMRRFSAYRRPGQLLPESTDAWAWNMYKSYFSELTSGRQKGFEKLFWEIFDQAYDRTLRAKQQQE